MAVGSATWCRNVALWTWIAAGTACVSPMSIDDERPKPLPKAAASAKAPPPAYVPAEPYRPPVAAASYQPPLKTSVPATKSLAGTTIVVDAGHGGKDPGSQGLSPVPEKTLTLLIAKDLAARLQARGANVVMSRSSDTFVELLDRAALAERNRANLLVSIHCDSIANSSTAGATIYTAPQATATSRRTATAVGAAFGRAGIGMQGLRSARFKVLVEHSRPSVLIETGYLTNPAECQRLNTAAHRAKLAEAIAEGIAQGVGR